MPFHHYKTGALSAKVSLSTSNNYYTRRYIKFIAYLTLFSTRLCVIIASLLLLPFPPSEGG